MCKQEGITQIGCWDHARRKFKDAQIGEKPQGKGNPEQKISLASTALAKIARLYANEKVIKEATHDDKGSTGNSTAFRFWRRSRPGWM